MVTYSLFLPPSLAQVEAECSALRNMVEERNAFITTMKSEIYRKEYLNDTEKMDLHQQLLQKDTIIKKLEVWRGKKWIVQGESEGGIVC